MMASFWTKREVSRPARRGLSKLSVGSWWNSGHHPATRASTAWRRAAFLRPIGESLESRCLLDGQGAGDYEVVSAEWFAQLPNSRPYADSIVGPLATASGSSAGDWQSEAEVADWIVRLTPEATQLASSVAGVRRLLHDAKTPFQVERGLGLPGEIVVRAAVDTEQVRSSLASNPHVAWFEPNSYVSTQRLPDDPDFPTLTGLHNVGQFGGTADADIDAPEAWDETIGSPTVVVGVIDSGIDVAHPDLYLNIWINQGEIPSALKPRLADTDADGRITFYDLNASANAALVEDLNHNLYIDAEDLLADPHWADGLDTDRNGFVDDFFGWNFRSAADEPFAPNDPRDVLGHGTHVAGTIGAMGDNGRGVVGINWRSSLMALKFLDDGNSGLTADAVAAVNYATMMRVDHGEMVRVLNASWGQSGTESPALRAAIEAAGQAEILFVAAAGNGNILGQGIDLDREPFYPASSDLPNVISVAASGPNDELARFSNFGATSVDLAAPGVGVLSTLPGGRYGTQNGTSMAAPHVAGTAALMVSLLPDASVRELQSAILGTVESRSEYAEEIASGGRLNVKRGLGSNAFAPRATLVNAENISESGGTENLITVRFRDRNGIDTATLGDGDIIATRQWGPRDVIEAKLVPGTVTTSSNGSEHTTTATYRVTAPGGTWDSTDYGPYVLSVGERQVSNVSQLAASATGIGEFTVQIADPTIFYVNSLLDAVDANVGDGIAKDASGRTTLRAAIQEANFAAPSPRTIILDAGTYRLSLPPVPDATVTFPARVLGGTAITSPTPWSNVTTGDLDVFGQVTMIGDASQTSTIDAAGLDRVFKVQADATLVLRRVGITGGVAPAGQDGGGILSIGTLELDTSLVAGNSTSAAGGGVAIWGGTARIWQTTVSDNSAFGNGGGGVLVCNKAELEISASTLARNLAPQGGGGLLSNYGGPTVATNSTFSGNDARNADGGAVQVLPARGSRYDSQSSSLSGNGRFVVFTSEASHLVPGDNNRTGDVFIFDRQDGSVARLSVAPDGTEGNSHSSSPSVSADGRIVAFQSFASNLVPDDSGYFEDVFVYDRQDNSITRISVAPDGTEADGGSSSASISSDGRFVAFESFASNLVPGVFGHSQNIYVYDRQTGTVSLISQAADAFTVGNSSFSPSISGDGRFVAFASYAPDLVPGDTNGLLDVFVHDRRDASLTRISMAVDGMQGDGDSHSPSVSSDGSLVAFASDATNLIPGDTNDRQDVFVYDRHDGSMTRISVAMNGLQGNSHSSSPSLSAGGRFVAFASYASNLVSGDTNESSDVFVYDQHDRSISLVSVATDGSSGNSNSSGPSVSTDGQFVVFESFASNLVVGDNNSENDLFVSNRGTDETTAVSLRPLSVLLEHVTVAENLSNSAVASVHTRNSLYSRNVSLHSLGTDIDDRTVSEGRNLFSVVSNGSLFDFTDLKVSGSTAWLGPLQDNGGFTWTHSIATGSPPIDAAATVVALQVDQRGRPRPQDGNGNFDPLPDIGAFESLEAKIQGVVFRDFDRDGERDLNEPGVAGQVVYLDVNRSAYLDPTEVALASRYDDLLTPAIVEQGEFVFDRLNPSTHRISVLAPPGWVPSIVGLTRINVAAGGTQGNRLSRSPSLNADGRFVAFESADSTLVPGDTNQASDIFVSDRQSGDIRRISLAWNGVEGNNTSSSPSISADGRFIAFESYASNLVFGDTNGTWDVFLYDCHKGTIVRVSEDVGGIAGNSFSFAPTVSGDGRFVVFASNASNLVPGDTNDSFDVFLYDRYDRTVIQVSTAMDGSPGNSHSLSPVVSDDGQFVAFDSYASNLVSDDTNLGQDVFVHDLRSGKVTRVSVAEDGSQGDHQSSSPAISSDGRMIAFVSFASNLVPDDAGWDEDVFLYDRQDGSLVRVSTATDGSSGDYRSFSPSLSADGRYVAFESAASNLLPGDTNGEHDVLVFDRQDRSIARMSVSLNGNEGNHGSFSPSLSADGRFISFESDASNLVPGDTNGVQDIFVTSNRKAVGADARSVSLFAGQVLSGVDFGLVPNDGAVQGQCFQDLIANGVRDAGEPGMGDCTIYLDANANGKFESGEASRTTSGAENDEYTFGDLPSEMEYRIGVVVPDGFQIVLPSPQESGVWKVFLPAGGTITDRDFGLRPVSTLGQSENASIAGHLFEDRDGNGRQNGDEPGLATTLFLDLNNDGIRQFDEPRTATDAQGKYLFPSLGNRPYEVRVDPIAQHEQTSPIGNGFSPKPYSLAVSGSPAGSPQDVVSADFNQDGWPDLATVDYDRNAVSMLLNDQHGGFVLAPPEISLAPRGIGPVAILAGDFNGTGSEDLAVVNSLSSTVTILLDFHGTQFTRMDAVTVGVLPNGIASGQLDADGDLDLIVTLDRPSSGGNPNLVILRNNGQGTFSVDSAPPVAGNHPAGVATGYFNDDTLLDVAVADYGTNPRGADLGDLRVFLANVGGGYTSSVACTVGFGPSAVTTVDLDGDDRLDLAVANFLSDNLTVCQGLGDGTFQSVATLSGGSGPMDLVAQDIDGDHDPDLLVSNGKSQKVGILRNDSTPGMFRFQPAESFGAAAIPGASRISLTAADFDRSGTVDLAVANSRENRILVNTNTLVGGAHRVVLTGVETITGLDFGFTPVNAPPTLEAIVNPPTANEDAEPIGVALRGISAGEGDSQPLSITVATTDSSNPSLIASLTPEYTSPLANGTLWVALNADQSGTVEISVTVMDGGLDENLSTLDDNGRTTRSFSITVNSLNDLPTLDAIPSPFVINRGVPTQTVLLTGITAGGGETQPLSIAASTTNPQWIRDLSVSRDGNGATATLAFTTNGPAGDGTITVTVVDGGPDGILATAGDNLSISRTMVVLASNSPPTVSLMNTLASIAENTNLPQDLMVADIAIADDGVGAQTLSLSGDDAPFFRIANGQLYLRRNVSLDFETSRQLTVSVVVDDPAVGTSPDAQVPLTIEITDQNEPPSIQLSPSSFSLAENSSTDVPRILTSLRVQDDELGTETLRLLGADAGFFALVDNTLVLREGTILDFETQSQYRVTVAVDDPGLGTDADATSDFLLTIQDVNESPVDMFLSNTRIQEGTDTTSAAALIGQLVVVDVDRGVIHYDFALIEGDGATDNGLFELSGRSLMLRQGVPVRAAEEGPYSIRLRVTDGPFTLEREFEITITDVNTAPTSIELRPSSVAENLDTSAAAVVVGSLVAADDNPPARHLFSFANGDGDDDNGLFSLSGNQLLLRQGSPVDFEQQSELSVRVAVFDGLNRLERALVIPVLDRNDPPTELRLTSVIIPERVHGAVVGQLSATDPDAGQTMQFSTSDPRLEIVGNTLQLRSDQFLERSAGGTATVEIQVTDSGVPPSSASFAVELTVLANSQPWRNATTPFDVSRDGNVTALDVLLIFNELNDPTVLGTRGVLPHTRPATGNWKALDVNGDGFCTALDALTIINFLNAKQGEGEGAGEGTAGAEAATARALEAAAVDALFADGWQFSCFQSFNPQPQARRAVWKTSRHHIRVSSQPPSPLQP